MKKSISMDISSGVDDLIASYTHESGDYVGVLTIGSYTVAVDHNSFMEMMDEFQHDFDTVTDV